jgi:phosphatidylserine/phosphatidylglycerophosphate/cardiolipin synthase-like enzyme
MSKVIAKAYRSPSMVLLAMDWPDGESHNDFLGFAIRRTPGFQNNETKAFAEHSWLPNRIGFNGPPAPGQPDLPSNEAPIQKFLWWDARVDGLTRNSVLKYEIFPVLGANNASELNLVDVDSTTVNVTLPPHVEFGIGTWFNRAVMSSQAFSRILDALHIHKGDVPSPEDALKLREWLANGMQKPLSDFISSAPSLVGAIYHLTDGLWVIPALKNAMNQHSIAMIYDAKVVKEKDTGEAAPNPNEGAITTLDKIKFYPRDKTAIMHNKFLVAGEELLSDSDALPKLLTCGSANYTTEGLTSQANLIHTFDSSELAALYLERFELLKRNPAKALTAKHAEWSRTISVGDAGMRAFFSPEPGSTHKSESISVDTIVEGIHAANSSVIFCLFTPTDERLRQACFAAGDAGKMMFGLVNEISKEEPVVSSTTSGRPRADQLAKLEIYHRSKDKKDVIGAEYFRAGAVPKGFEPEINIFPGEQPPKNYAPVIIHHKFIVIDAETDSPTIYTGSANMSGNSEFNNDENLLEISGSPRLASIYLAEFLRLYEHYRARAKFIAVRENRTSESASEFALARDRSWANRHYTPGTPEYKARVRMLAV